MHLIINCLLIICFFNLVGYAQNSKHPIYTRIDFADSLQPWDGFGVNYVQSAQCRNKDSARFEDYGGFSELNESQRKEILELIFGENGLRPSLLKMFLDPFHQNVPDGPFDHKSTTTWLRYFVKNGLELTKKRGGELTIMTTLYGPPAWATKQKFFRGRDLDSSMKIRLCEYMASWVKYLKEDEQVPVKFLSLHNEGENPNRWDPEGITSGDLGHDHNLYWPKEQIIEFLKIIPPILKKYNLEDVGLTPGETVGWKEMIQFDIAQSLSMDTSALKQIQLITSHSFTSGSKSVVNNLIRTSDKIKNKRYLHSWITSTSFVTMNTDFLYNFHHEIYDGGVNGIIPWALIQVKDKWTGGDPNKGCAIWIENGNFIIRKGYFYLKTFTQIGQAGTHIVKTYSLDKDIVVTGFGKGKSNQKNAFNILNVYKKLDKKIIVHISGAEDVEFEAFRTSENENYVFIGKYKVRNGRLEYNAPRLSSTTFIATRK